MVHPQPRQLGYPARPLPLFEPSLPPLPTCSMSTADIDGAKPRKRIGRLMVANY